jgi:FkbM family methyltransferase
MHVLTSPLAAHPLWCRPNTSDRAVFDQIFTCHGYACLSDRLDIRLIIDCGAYVGYSAAYFLTCFPHSKVIAIEPDPGNFGLLRKNMAPYADRVALHHAAAWSHPARLRLSETKYRDGQEWSRQVRECEPGEPSAFRGVEVGALFRGSGYDRISVLKIDIEGAEAMIFNDEYKYWIDNLDNLLIEIHDDSTFGDNTALLEGALAGRGFRFSRFGELTVCSRD